MKTKLLLGIVTVLITLVTASVNAFADSPQEYRALDKVTAQVPRVRLIRRLGRVVAVEGQIITVKNPRGRFDILTDEETRFLLRGAEDPSIEDVQVGDLVAGRVVKQEDGTLLAKGIAVIPLRTLWGKGLGKVTAVEGRTITVRNRGGTVRVVTDRETRFRVRGVENPSIEDIHAGDWVIGRVVKQDGTLLAKVVAVVRPAPDDTP